MKKTHMLRCAQSPRSNVRPKYASARLFFARLASEIFLSSLQSGFRRNLLVFISIEFAGSGSAGHLFPCCRSLLIIPGAGSLRRAAFEDILEVRVLGERGAIEHLVEYVVL